MNYPAVVTTMVGLAIANAAVAPDWMQAVDRTVYQGIALLAYGFSLWIERRWA